MIAPSTRRRAVVPSAPTSGNRFLASDAPLWIETMATSNKAMGTRSALRDMGYVLVVIIKEKTGRWGKPFA